MFNAMKLGTIEISTMKMKVNNVTILSLISWRCGGGGGGDNYEYPTDHGDVVHDHHRRCQKHKYNLASTVTIHSPYITKHLLLGNFILS